MKPITVSEWEKAERDYLKFKGEPQRKGSVTAEQYAVKIGRHLRTAQEHLSRMYKAGILEREQWNSAEHNKPWVYWPKKKKK